MFHASGVWNAQLHHQHTQSSQKASKWKRIQMSLFVIPNTTIRPNSLIDSTCCLKPFLSLSFLNHTSCDRVSGPSPNLFRNQRVRVHLSIRRHPIHRATCPSSHLHHIKLMDRLECFLYPLFFRYRLQSTRSRVPTNTQETVSDCDWDW